ncbi:MAG: hypothetical protein H6Q73_1383 [Firmicutes bacterium]|nr:hypothetical protein [Bacillota bacterium]
MTLSGVKCTVANCKYHSQGDACSASNIEVNIDGGGQSAQASRETNCKTFITK